MYDILVLIPFYKYIFLRAGRLLAIAESQLMKLLDVQEKITVLREGRFVQILPKDIYYFEAVDNKVFVYLEKDVYECKLKLYELEQRALQK